MWKAHQKCRSETRWLFHIVNDLNTFKPDISHEFQFLLGKRPSVYLNHALYQCPPQVPAHGRLRLPPQNDRRQIQKAHLDTKEKMGCE